jgi:hypothetical protein
MLALKTMRILAAKMIFFFVGLTLEACFQIERRTLLSIREPLQ